MKLIDAENLEILLRKLVDETDCNIAIVPDVIGLVREQPPIDPVHAAGGCYCRECAYCGECAYCDENRPFCNQLVAEIQPNNFCFFGHREE